MWSWHDSSWAWLWMGAMMVAFWAVVAVAVLLAARTLKSSQYAGQSSRPQARSPQDILAERYARGDIEADEYRRRLDEIHSHDRR
jgi:putative membrane protein